MKHFEVNPGSILAGYDKAKEAYDQWLAKVKQIEEENPYIE
mgnify:CR=1 FL=1